MSTDLLRPSVASRRGFLARAGALSAGIAGAGLIGRQPQARAADAAAAVKKGKFSPSSGKAFSITDVDIFNFALNLEYLEAEFYSMAVFGQRLGNVAQTTGVGSPGTITGGRQVTFTNSYVRQIAEEIASDEIAHVQALHAALGSRAVASPSIDIGDSFTTAAIAAGIISTGQTFDPYADENSFLLGAFVFEDVGVTAYHGAAPYVNNSDYLSAAAGIEAVEAYHAATIRTLLTVKGQTTPALITTAGKISDLRDGADGEVDDDQGLIDANGNVNIVPTDANGIAFARTFNQVLNIVYLGGAAANFGFFPNRVNGRIA